MSNLIRTTIRFPEEMKQRMDMEWKLGGYKSFNDYVLSRFEKPLDPKKYVLPVTPETPLTPQKVAKEKKVGQVQQKVTPQTPETPKKPTVKEPTQKLSKKELNKLKKKQKSKEDYEAKKRQRDQFSNEWLEKGLQTLEKKEQVVKPLGLSKSSGGYNPFGD